jgi:hypothetical protein
VFSKRVLLSFTSTPRSRRLAGGSSAPETRMSALLTWTHALRLSPLHNNLGPPPPAVSYCDVRLETIRGELLRSRLQCGRLCRISAVLPVVPSACRLGRERGRVVPGLAWLPLHQPGCDGPTYLPTVLCLPPRASNSRQNPKPPTAPSRSHHICCCVPPLPCWLVKMLLVLGVRNPQSTACEVWSLRFQD